VVRDEGHPRVSFHTCHSVADPGGFARSFRAAVRIVSLTAGPAVSMYLSDCTARPRPNDPMTALILRDIANRRWNGSRALGLATPILDLARIHVAAYETVRAREQVAA
jgi:hypothetical protein